MDPERREARELVFKSLVQLERWDDAQEALNDIETHLDRRRFYLKGFLLRKRRRHREAIVPLKAAVEAGDRSQSVYRDLADSQYRCGDYEEALANIRIVLDKNSENPFAVDLHIRICLEKGDVTQAERALEGSRSNRLRAAVRAPPACRCPRGPEIVGTRPDRSGGRNGSGRGSIRGACDYDRHPDWHG